MDSNLVDELVSLHTDSMEWKAQNDIVRLTRASEDGRVVFAGPLGECRRELRMPEPASASSL